MSDLNRQSDLQAVKLLEIANERDFSDGKPKWFPRCLRRRAPVICQFDTHLQQNQRQVDRCPELAEQFRVQAQQAGITLEWDLESAQRADSILSALRYFRATREQMDLTAYAAGCYLGEAMVRTMECEWIRAGEVGFPLAAPDRPIISFVGRDHFSNPIGKAFKRLWDGPSDNIVVMMEPRDKAVFERLHQTTEES